MVTKSIRTRLATAIIGLSALSSLALMLAAGMSARHFLRDQLRHRLMAVAASGALMVPGEDLSNLTGRADEATPTYRATQQHLRATRCEHRPALCLYDASQL